MPVFHFHLRSPKGVERDNDGVTYPDLDKAYLEACKAIPTLATEFLRAGDDPMACSFLITDGDGVVLMEVPFRERVKERRHRPPPTMATHTACERAQQLVADIQEERDSLWLNLAKLRGLLDEVAVPNHRGRLA